MTCFSRLLQMGSVYRAPVLSQKEKIYTCMETTFSNVDKNINGLWFFSRFSCNIHAF